MNSPETEESEDISLEAVVTNANETLDNIPGLTYSDFFNDSVKEFFSLTYLNITTKKSLKSKNSGLQASKTTLNSCYYHPTKKQARQNDFILATNVESITSDGPTENCLNSSQNSEQQQSKEIIEKFNSLPGTYWTGEEKDVFFNCLARFTIHRADEFGPHLPNKSLADIYAYYTLLKSELKNLKRRELVEDESIDSHVAVEVTPAGVRYSDLPIAHEVDDDTIDYEEEQSIILSNIEQVLSSKRASKKATFFNEYTKQEVSEDSSLIEKVDLHNLAKIYRGNQLFPCLNGRKSCRLYYNSYVFLEELIKYRTRELLGNIISKKAIVSNDPIDESCFQSTAQASIYTQDIWKAVVDLKWFETSMGDRTRYRDGKYPFLEAYWQRLVQSLDISVKDHQQVLDQSAVVLKSFKACELTVNHLDHFLHSPSINVLECCDDDSIIEVGARGYEEEEWVIEDEVQTINVDLLVENGNSTVKELLKTADDCMLIRRDSSSSEAVEAIISPTTMGNESKEKLHEDSTYMNMKDDLTTSPRTSRSLWLYKHVRAPKRSLEDCEGEDRLLQLEEINLDLLDERRDSKYLQSMRKKLKLDAEDTAESQTFQENMILENLNYIWDRSFAFY